MHHCAAMQGCLFCKSLSRIFGHPLMFLVGKRWERVERKDVVHHMNSLQLQLVGGLVTRGWTVHDIDVIGSEADVPLFVQRLERSGIHNPVHFCDDGFVKHSHLRCIREGLEVLFLGNAKYNRVTSQVPVSISGRNTR